MEPGAAKDADLLPCPYCGASIVVPVGRYFPGRRWPIACAACGGQSVLPIQSVLLGLAVMMPIMVIGILAIKPLFRAPETPLEFLYAGGSFLAVSWICTRIGSWAARQVVHGLTPYKPPPSDIRS